MYSGVLGIKTYSQMGMSSLRLQARGGAVVHRNVCSILIKVDWSCGLRVLVVSQLS